MEFKKEEAEKDSLVYLPEKGYKRIAVITFYILIGIIVILIAIKCTFDFFLPFVLAWLVSMLLRPLLINIRKRTKLPHRLLCVLALAVFFLLAGAAIFWVIQRLIFEAGNALGALIDNYDAIEAKVMSMAEWIAARLPSHNGTAVADVDAVIEAGLGMVQSTVSTISSKLPMAAAAVASKLPGIMFFTVILVMSSYYISADLGKINKRLVSFIPDKAKSFFYSIYGNMKYTGLSYMRAYLFIMLITFAELLTGFLIIGIRYAAIAAMIIAFADMLPVIGVGMIMIPWALVLILQGKSYQGIGILLILVVIEVLRQVLQPKIVSETTGLSPLLTLICMYAGFRVAGFAGLIFLPMIVLIIKNTFFGTASEADCNNQSPEK